MCAKYGCFIENQNIAGKAFSCKIEVILNNTCFLILNMGYDTINGLK